VIGRTKLDTIEIADKRPDAHVTLNTVEDADGNELKILWDNMPFGSIASGEFGTYRLSAAQAPHSRSRHSPEERSTAQLRPDGENAAMTVHDQPTPPTEPVWATPQPNDAPPTWTPPAGTDPYPPAGRPGRHRATVAVAGAVVSAA
jgi:Dyp-type peroxidase family